MSMTTTTLSGDGTVLVGTLIQKARETSSDIGVHAHGDYGTGSLTFQYSLDGGTTKATIKDGSGTAATNITYTASGGFTWVSPVTTGSSPVLLYAVLASSTAPDIDVYIIDKNFG